MQSGVRKPNLMVVAGVDSAPPHVYAQRMYAIAFDMDTAAMEKEYGKPGWRSGYADIGNALAEHGFDRQQGSVYFGNEKVTAVSCVLAAQDLAKRFPWFKPCVKDIRMLRIEENNDLGVAIAKVPAAPAPPAADSLFDAA